MTTAQQRIEREAATLESILRDHPEVRCYVEQAYRRGYSHGVFNYRDNVEQGYKPLAIAKWSDVVYDWRHQQSSEKTPGYLGNWTMPPVCIAPVNGGAHA